MTRMNFFGFFVFLVFLVFSLFLLFLFVFCFFRYKVVAKAKEDSAQRYRVRLGSQVIDDIMLMPHQL